MDSAPAPSAAAASYRESDAWWRSTYLTTPVAMSIAVAPYVFHLRFFRMLRTLGLQAHSWHTSPFVWFIQVALLTLLVLFWERRPLDSIGLRLPKLDDLRWGITAFVIIEVGDFLWLSATLPTTGTEPAQRQLAAWASQPEAWKLLLAVSAGFFEETFFRGYTIERVEEISGSMALGAILGTMLDLSVHMTYWTPSLVIAMVFSEFSLALLYLWRRSIPSCVVAHFLLDVLS